MKKALALITVVALLFAGCNILQPVESSAPTEPAYVPDDLDAPPADVEFEKNDEELFTDLDSNGAYAEGSSAVISLDGNSASCNAASVTISGTTITITKGGTYIVRGNLDDGMIIVDAGEKDRPQIVLEGASITSSASAALYVRSAKKVFVTLAPGTENTLVNGGSFVAIDENDIDAAVYAKQDISFNGSGSLTVTSPAGHGMVCKDDMVITEGNYTVQSAFHGLDANDSVRINGGTLTIDAGKDGIHSEDPNDTTTGFVYLSGGIIHIEAEGDGVSAALSAQVSGGELKILAGGGYENGTKQNSGGYGDFMGGGMWPGSRPGGRVATTAAATDDSTSMKGIKAGAGLLINAGTLTIDSADDALHSDTVTVINGGYLHIDSGDDGIHAETDLTITAGDIRIGHSYEGMEAQNISISGGDISLVSTDDGLNAAGGVDSSGGGGRDQMAGRVGPMGGSSNGSIVISGGKLYIQASGDGIDANGTLKITGGYTMVCGPNSGDTATLDYDVSGIITGGVFIGTGSTMMAQSFSAGSQGTIAINAGGQSAGTKITVTDSQGNVLLSHEPELAFSVFIFSTPDLVSGQSYQLTIGSLKKEVKAN